MKEKKNQESKCLNEYNFTLVGWEISGSDSLRFLKIKSNLDEFTLLWRRSLSYRNQSNYLPCKSMDWFLFDRDLHCSRIPTAEANFVKNTKKNLIIMLIFPNIILSRINIRVCFVQWRSNSDSRNSTRCNNAPFTKNSWVSCGFGHIYWKNPERKTSIFVQWFLKRPQISQLLFTSLLGDITKN